MRLLAAILFVIAWSCAGRAEEGSTVPIVYLGLAPKPQPSTLLEPAPADEGLQGARLAIGDNETTGRFTGQHFALQENIAPNPAAAVEAAKQALAQGRKLLVTDLPAETLLAVADLPGAKDALLLDATSEDDALRGAQCRRNVLHLLPSDAMRADALMQYLTVKRWRDILLVTGPTDADRKLGDALRRSARKFQLRLAADKPWQFKPGAQRTDTGHVGIAGMT